MRTICLLLALAFSLNASAQSRSSGAGGSGGGSSLPSQTGNSGKFLSTDGSTASWNSVTGFATTDLSNLASVAINTDLIFSTGAAATLKTKNEATSKAITITSGTSNANINSGAVTVKSANATGTGLSGATSLLSGTAASVYSGDVLVSSGNVTGSGAGTTTITTGTTAAEGGGHGVLYLTTGDVLSSSGSSVAPNIFIQTGTTPGATGDSSGNVFITTGQNAYQTGDITIYTGNGTVVDTAYSGNMQFLTGSVTGTAASGSISINPGSVGTGTRGGVTIGSFIQLDSTVTAGGTTGAQTINKASGTVNFAAAATAVVVTDSIVTANSLCFTEKRTNDATCNVKSVVPGAGSFTITMTAGCAAETSVGFLCINQ